MLDVNIHHALTVADLPMHHEDPFDRMQLAQPRRENLILVSHDRQVQQYDVSLLRV